MTSCLEVWPAIQIAAAQNRAGQSAQHIGMIRRQGSRLLKGGKGLVIALQLEQHRAAVEQRAETARIQRQHLLKTGPGILQPFHLPQDVAAPEPGFAVSGGDFQQAFVALQRLDKLAKVAQQTAAIEQGQGIVGIGRQRPVEVRKRFILAPKLLFGAAALSADIAIFAAPRRPTAQERQAPLPHGPVASIMTPRP